MIRSKRALLEEISSGIASWEPADDSLDALMDFQPEAGHLIDALHVLVMSGYIGKYSIHRETNTGKRYIDRIIVTVGLTEAGQDRRNWPH